MPGSPGGLNPGGAVGREGQGGGAATGCSWLHSQGCHDRRELFDVPAPDAFPAAASSQGLVGAGARPVWGLRGRFPGSTSLGQPGLGWSLGETERGWTGQEAPLHRCSLQLPCFSKPLGLYLAECLGLRPWDGTLAGSLAPVPHPLLPMLPGPACRRGFPKRLWKVQGVRSLSARRGAPACTQPFRKAVTAAEERPLQTVLEQGQEDGLA